MHNDSKAARRASRNPAALPRKTVKGKKSATRSEQTTANLERAEGFFQAITQNSFDIIFVLNQDGFITYVNSTVERFLGYKPEELAGKSSLDLILPEDRSRAAREFVQAVQTRDVIVRNGFRVRHKDGSVRFLEGVGNNLLDDPVVAGFVMNVRDVTERMRIEAALLERDKQYRLVFENADEAIVIDQDGRHQFVNRRAIEILGHSAEELTSRPFVDFVHPDHREMVTERYTKRMKGEYVPNVYPLKIITEDGTAKWIEIHVNLVTWNGKPASLNFFSDITDRIQAEEALREKEEKYRTLIETTGTGFVIIDQNGCVLDANQEYVRLTGHRDTREIIGRSVIEWTAGYEKEKNAAAVAECLTKGYIRNLEIDYVNAGGDVIPVEINATCMESEGATHILTLCRDITDRRRLERSHEALQERLHRAEKMEALGTLAGGVAHDLNNVLGVLIGYSELLAEKLPADSPLRRYADNILRSGVRGAATIQDLLTLARRGVTVAEVVNLNKIVSDYLRTIEFEKLKSYHPEVEIRTDLEEGLLNIKGSAVHLEKTLMNLVANSVDAISDFGDVTIRTENRYLDKPVRGYDDIREGDYCILTISDTGKGISRQDIAKIFEPFYTKKIMGRTGTGLGLSVVWGTVKDHNGYIDVESEEGKGSRFTLYFPVTREAPPLSEYVSSPGDYMGRGETVLVVDDVREQRELAKSMLERLGYRVECATGGEEAVAYLKSKKADLVVLDMIMDPGIDGLETFERLLKMNPSQKAIIVSGFSETDRIRKAQELGAGAFVRKPYILENIGLAVRSELDRK
jgi:two-component system cell cycle sensor histidine kinase/response regulator CckA